MDEERDDDEEKQTIKKPLWNSFCRHRKCRGFTNSSAEKSLFYFLWTSLPFPQTYHPLNVYCLFYSLRLKQQHNWSITYGSFAKALSYIWHLVSFSNTNAHKKWYASWISNTQFPNKREYVLYEHNNYHLMHSKLESITLVWNYLNNRSTNNI